MDWNQPRLEFRHPYLAIDQLLDILPDATKIPCLNLLNQNRQLIEKAPGSSSNHQAWPGGYADHVTEVMNLAVELFKAMEELRPLPFQLIDALLVLFLHDIEKPWKYGGEPMPNKSARKAFREKLIDEYDIPMTPDQLNALTYVEGEGDDYSNSRRIMNELAGFCHMCDVASARVWHDKGASHSWK